MPFFRPFSSNVAKLNFSTLPFMAGSTNIASLGIFNNRLLAAGTSLLRFDDGMHFVDNTTTIIGAFCEKIVVDGTTRVYLSNASNLFYSDSGDPGSWVAIPATGITGTAFCGAADGNGNIGFFAGSGGTNFAWTDNGGASWNSAAIDSTRVRSTSITHNALQYHPASGMWTRIGTLSCNISDTLLGCVNSAGVALPGPSLGCFGLLRGVYYTYSASDRLFYYSTDFITWNSFPSICSGTINIISVVEFDGALYFIGDVGLCVRVNDPGDVQFLTNGFATDRLIDIVNWGNTAIAASNTTAAFTRLLLE